MAKTTIVKTLGSHAEELGVREAGRRAEPKGEGSEEEGESGSTEEAE
jgi:hypothetical protein